MSEIDSPRCQYWRTRPYGIEKQSHFRLEDLPRETANQPRGRGPSVSAGRGADVEKVLEIVIEGAKIDRRPYFDAWIYDDTSPWYTSPHSLIEAKSCINWYPSGTTGTFRICKKNHRRLVNQSKLWGSKNYYFLLIYRMNKMEEAIEIGKIMTSAEAIDSIIGDRLQYDTHQYRTSQYVDLPWTRVISELGVSIEMLRNWELVHA